jgi:hypothetical protein
VKILGACCLGFALIAFPASAARLTLPPVPHFAISPLPLPQPSAPPRYTQHYDQGDTEHNNAYRKSKNSKTLWELITDDAVAFTTLCLVGVTAVLAASTIGLWIVTARAGRRQSQDMQRSIGIAERALVSVERAFVFVKGYAQIPQVGQDGYVSGDPQDDLRAIAQDAFVLTAKVVVPTSRTSSYRGLVNSSTARSRWPL